MTPFLLSIKMSQLIYAPIYTLLPPLSLVRGFVSRYNLLNTYWIIIGISKKESRGMSRGGLDKSSAFVCVFSTYIFPTHAHLQVHLSFLQIFKNDLPLSTKLITCERLLITVGH